jgi:hypothetical protein
MIDFGTYSSYLKSKGRNLSEVRKNQSDKLMNATFLGDVGYKRVYILDPQKGWKYTDAHYSKHSAASIVKDEVDSYLQFRPKEHYPIGTYVFIPDDTDFDLDINEEHPFEGDTKNLWLIVGRNDAKQFVRYLVLRCNWNLKWVVGYGDQKRILNCWCIARNANSYTSCDMRKYIARLAAFGNIAVYSCVYAGTPLEPYS